MSRAKKRAKAAKRLHLAQAAALAEQTQRERDVADMIGDLSCGYAAADELAATCAYRHGAASVDLELVVAAELLWRRAAHPAHPLTATLADLRVELERHRDAIIALQHRFDALMTAAPHDHITPDPDDILRVRSAVLGPEALDDLPRPTA
jgi:hypothetical protein